MDADWKGEPECSNYSQRCHMDGDSRLPFTEQEQLLLQQLLIVLMKEAQEDGSSRMLPGEVSLIATQFKEYCERAGLVAPDMEFLRKYVNSRDGAELLLRVRLKEMLDIATNPEGSGYTRNERLLLRTQILTGCSSIGIEPPDMSVFDEEHG